MLQNGPSRTLLEKWAPDAKNGVIITGYSVEGTMAKEIMKEPDQIQAVTGKRNAGMQLGKRLGALADGERQMIPRRCTVQEFNFAVHVDGQENREFIEEVGAPVVILVHGEKHNMARLKSRLLGLGKMKVYSPANCEEVRIPFRQDKIARVVGRLASQISPPTLLPSPPASGEDEDEEMDEGGESKKIKSEASSHNQGQVISGVLVQNDFKLSLMAPEDLKEYAGLTTTTIVCRQRITLGAAGVDLIKWALEGTFGTVSVVSPEKPETNGAKNEEAADEELPRHEDTITIFDVMGGSVRITCRDRGELELEWEGNATNDSVADAVMAVLMTVESSPAAVKQSSQLHSHDHGHGHGHFSDGEKKTNGLSAKPKNLHANVPPEEKLSRLCMFLEAQFGEDAVNPIAKPRVAVVNGLNGDANGDEIENGVDEIAQSKAEATELTRLHGLGIPVPGLEIRVDKSVAKVWLEKLDVECANKTLGDRVKAVVERAVDTVAPLWQ
jgi:cleavage and polyadenylation specificity factor subunit 3